MTRGFASPAGWIFALLAFLTAAGAVWAASSDADAHAAVTAIDNAPVCASSSPLTATENCKAESAATVESVSVSRRKVHVATITLRTSGGATLVTGVTGGTPGAGDSADVVVWRGRCVTIRTDGQGTLTTYDNPVRSLSNDGAAFLAAMVFTVLFESVSATFLTYHRVDRERMAAAYLLAAVPLVVTGMLRLSHAYTAMVVAGVAVPLLVLGLYAMWPRLTWAQRRAV